MARWRHSLLCIPASATGLLADSDSELPAKVCMQAPQHRQAGRLKRRKHAPQCPSLYIPSNLTGARLALAGWLADWLPAHPPPACLSPENVRPIAQKMFHCSTMSVTADRPHDEHQHHPPTDRTRFSALSLSPPLDVDLSIVWDELSWLGTAGSGGTIGAGMAR